MRQRKDHGGIGREDAVQQQWQEEEVVAEEETPDCCLGADLLLQRLCQWGHQGGAHQVRRGSCVKMGCYLQRHVGRGGSVARVILFVGGGDSAWWKVLFFMCVPKNGSGSG